MLEEYRDAQDEHLQYVIENRVSFVSDMRSWVTQRLKRPAPERAPTPQGAMDIPRRALEIPRQGKGRDPVAIGRSALWTTSPLGEAGEYLPGGVRGVHGGEDAAADLSTSRESDDVTDDGDGGLQRVVAVCRSTYRDQPQFGIQGVRGPPQQQPVPLFPGLE